MENLVHMRYLVMSWLLVLSTLLAACFPVSIKRNDAPAIPYLREGGSGTVLVLVISETYRQGAWARLGGSAGLNRLFHAPMFIAESELKALRGKLTRYSTGILFLSYLGSWVEKYHERVVEICLIWPTGEVVALGRPSLDNRWQREFKGMMSVSWRDKMVEAISTAKSLTSPSPPDACPYAETTLDWLQDERAGVIGFLNRITLNDISPERLPGTP